MTFWQEVRTAWQTSDAFDKMILATTLVICATGIVVLLAGLWAVRGFSEAFP
jgi:hypothetical protein